MHWLYAFSYKRIVYEKKNVKFISVFGLYAVGYNQNYKLRKYRVKKNNNKRIKYIWIDFYVPQKWQNYISAP